MRNKAPADKNNLRLRIAEAGDRTTPVLLVAECGSPGGGNFLTPFHETGTEPTIDQVGTEGGELRLTHCLVAAGG